MPGNIRTGTSLKWPLAGITQYLGLALAVIALLGMPRGYFSSGERQLKTELALMRTYLEGSDKKLIEHDRRIQAVETESQASAPTRTQSTSSSFLSLSLRARCRH